MEQAQAIDHTELSTVSEGCSRVLSAKPGIGPAGRRPPAGPKTQSPDRHPGQRQSFLGQGDHAGCDRRGIANMTASTAQLAAKSKPLARFASSQ